MSIKGNVSTEPSDGLVPGYSASGQDVWIPAHAAQFDRPGLILSAVGARCGKVFQSPARGPWGVVANTASFFPTSRAEVRYLYYLLNQPDFWQVGGGAQPYVQVDASLGAPVPLLGVEEQRRIADFLDDRVARIDQIIAARRQQVSLLAASRAERTERVISGAGPERRLAHLLLLSAVGVVVNPSSYFKDEGVPFVHGYNVREGFFDLSDLKRMSPEDSTKLARSQLRAGDVLVVRAGYPGRAAVVPAELAGGNCASVLLLRTNESLSPGWLAAFMNSPLGVAAVEQVQYGAAQGVVNLADVLEFRIPLPEIHRQNELLRDLSAMDERLRSLRATLELQVSRLQEYKQSLITAAVTGELDVTTASTRIPEQP